ncbi:hypothetical protein [Pseudomonas sp. NCCP-436]|uniref:hypothetical protein n=1 Tax=Pseudomonas sp. NCCP-436 TaxID=2842481 RepID=UPI001D216451|nr:hypothetical protein [Pseudomonas sp. NCCP-436]GIZ11647.1 hypothetical protein NCCP436_10630 [Pseudomonas sp. NCCP-436]
MLPRHCFLVLALIFFSCFSLSTQLKQPPDTQPELRNKEDRVVVSAPILLFLYGGDNYLAANLEAIRLASTGIDESGTDTAYLTRAQHEVSKLNPCHEDNYYLANALLTWGGAVSEGNKVLKSAIQCRFWDGVAPFFYGVNKVFFDREKDEAIQAFELAAERWPVNSAALRRLAITLRAEQFSDEHLALNYLTQQRDSATDPLLQEMLSRRVTRLHGLIQLREAQRRYEKKHGNLHDISQLVETGELTAIPEDPLGLGYELQDGHIDMKTLKIEGMESQQ